MAVRSDRPDVKTRHEQRHARREEQERRRRDRRLVRGTPGRVALEPVVTSVSRGAPASPIPPAVQAWIDEEARAQLARYRRIAREMAALAPQRERWVKEFFERITGPRGFSVHAGVRRTIPVEELPPRPQRPWRVIW